MSAPDAPGTDADLAGGLRILASGTDYRRENLTPPPAKVTAASPEHDMAGPDRLGAAAGHDPLAAAAPQLRRLVDRGALHACLGALVTAYGGRPTSVDYARSGAPRRWSSTSRRAMPRRPGSWWSGRTAGCRASAGRAVHRDRRVTRGDVAHR